MHMMRQAADASALRALQQFKRFVFLLYSHQMLSKIRQILLNGWEGGSFLRFGAHALPGERAQTWAAHLRAKPAVGRQPRRR